MSLVGARQLIEAAGARGGAVAAFNAITLEHAEAIVGGAADTGRPVIVQVSENAALFHDGDPRPLLLGARALAESVDVPVALHLDHVQDAGLLDRSLTLGEAGLGSVMVDAARLDYADNVRVTAEFTRRAHDAGLGVEAELGEVGGKNGAHAPGVRTDPGEAADFVAATGVDALAVAVGSSHAMTARTAALDLDLVAELAAAVPVPLVLHGSSGVPDDTLVAAARAGIRKINIGTVLNVVGTAALRAELAAKPDAVDPRAALRASRAAMRAEVGRLLALLP